MLLGLSREIKAIAISCRDPGSYYYSHGTIIIIVIFTHLFVKEGSHGLHESHVIVRFPPYTVVGVGLIGCRHGNQLQKSNSLKLKI